MYVNTELIIAARDLEIGDDIGLDDYDGPDAQTRVVGQIDSHKNIVAIRVFGAWRDVIIFYTDDTIEIERMVQQ